METFSALLAICAGNSPVPGEFPAQRPVTWQRHGNWIVKVEDISYFELTERGGQTIRNILEQVQHALRGPYFIACQYNLICERLCGYSVIYNIYD